MSSTEKQTIMVYRCCSVSQNGVKSDIRCWVCGENTGLPWFEVHQGYGYTKADTLDAQSWETQL